MAHRFSWRGAAVCLKLVVDRTRLANCKNVEIDLNGHSVGAGEFRRFWSCQCFHARPVLSVFNPWFNGGSILILIAEKQA